jgi:hypothetical protein
VEVAQFGADRINEMVRDTSVDAFMTVAPLDAKMTIDAILATARLRGEPTFLPVDVSEAITAHQMSSTPRPATTMPTLSPLSSD